MTRGTLRGWAVGVTADRRADEQIELLERRGARVLHGPVIRVVPSTPDDRFRTALDELVARPPDFVVLTTGVGTRSWFEAADALEAGEALRASLASAEVHARGPKAAGAAVTAGLEVRWQAPGATSAELVAHLRGRGLAGRRVAVQLDGRDRPVLAEALAGLGADVVPVAPYRWEGPLDPGPALRLAEAVVERRLDAVTFTSGPALCRLLELAGPERAAPLVEAFATDVDVVSVGPVCSATARNLRIEPAVQPARHRLGAMVHALASHAEAADERRVVPVGDRRVVLRAGAVRVDDVVVELPGRERAVLAVLLERADAVVEKQTLLRRAGFGDAAPHAVEAAVGRLRRRLEGLLDVVAVTRRGYLLTAT